MTDEQLQYAGFWKRVIACLIDAMVLSVANLILLLPFLGLLGVGIGAASMEEEEAAAGFVALAIGAYLISIVAITVGGWLYYALMESSAKQATLGKLAIGIIVTDMEGRRVSFGRATGRYFGKIISTVILYVGFMMAGFTQQKQALHDIIAGCLVKNKT